MFYIICLIFRHILLTRPSFDEFVIQNGKNFFIVKAGNNEKIHFTNEVDKATVFTLTSFNGKFIMNIKKTNFVLDFNYNEKKFIVWTRHSQWNQQFTFEKTSKKNQFKIKNGNKCLEKKENYTVLSDCDEKNEEQVYEFLHPEIAKTLDIDKDEKLVTKLSNGVNISQGERALSYDPESSSLMLDSVKDKVVRILFEKQEDYFRIKMNNSDLYLDDSNPEKIVFSSTEDNPDIKLFGIQKKSETIGKIVSIDTGMCLSASNLGMLMIEECSDDEKQKFIFEASFKPKNFYLSLVDVNGMISPDSDGIHLTNERDNSRTKKFHFIETTMHDEYYIGVGNPLQYLTEKDGNLLLESKKSTIFTVEESQNKYLQIKYKSQCLQYDTDKKQVILAECSGDRISQLFVKFENFIDKTVEKLLTLRRNYITLQDFLEGKDFSEENDQNNQVEMGIEERKKQILELEHKKRDLSRKLSIDAKRKRTSDISNPGNSKHSIEALQ